MRPQRWIRLCMLIAWAVIMYFGTTAYHHIYGEYTKKELQTKQERWVRAGFSSLQLFAFNIDSNAVDGWKDKSDDPDAHYSDQLHYTAIAAGVWTIFFIVLLLFKSVLMWIVRHFYSQLIRKDLYVFWGINRRSIQMANELGEKCGWRNVLFVVQPEASYEDTSEGLKQILHRSRYRDALKHQIGTANAAVLIASSPITEQDKLSFWRTWRKMGLSLMCRFIIRTTRHIHIMLLGDDESQNIYDSLKLCNDALWPAFWPFKSRKFTIHCHARRSNANRVIEDVANHSVIEIVDSSRLAVELLKKDPTNHPIRFVDTRRGVVSSSFNSLIVGFSECGQDALRFLYEFSAFVNAKCRKEEEDERSPFHIHIIDKQLSPSAARWMHHASQMFQKTNSDGTKCIHFDKLISYDSNEFYSEVLDKIIDELNYVIIAVGDDRAGITLAVDILRYAIKKGRVKNQMTYYSSKEKFRIYVRSYDPSMYDYLQTIATLYNEEAEYITIFGAEQDLYTKQMLIDESLKQHAMSYQYNYHKVAKEHFSWERDVKATKEEDWEERRTLAYEHKSLDEIQNLRRQESQDYANALHLETKKCLKLYGATPLRLAQTEHLRWIAAHEIMGYSSYCPNGKSKDILHYGHSDMIPWKDLDGNTREYDFLTFNELYSKDELSKAIEEAKKIKNAQPKL